MASSTPAVAPLGSARAEIAADSTLVVLIRSAGVAEAELPVGGAPATEGVGTLVIDVHAVANTATSKHISAPRLLMSASSARL